MMSFALSEEYSGWTCGVPFSLESGFMSDVLWTPGKISIVLKNKQKNRCKHLTNTGRMQQLPHVSAFCYLCFYDFMSL